MTDSPEEEILFPDIDLELDGHPVKISEYRFIDGMKVNVLARLMLVDLAALFSTAGADHDAISMPALNAIFGQHAEVVLELIALSTGENPLWIADLSDDDGQLLLMTWWRVNSAFFTRRLVADMVARRETEALQKTQAEEDARQETLHQQALDLAESAHA